MKKKENADAIPERLVPVYEEYDAESLTDHLLLMAKDIDNALLQAGAIPGRDYTYIPLFELAVQYRAPL